MSALAQRSPRALQVYVLGVALAAAVGATALLDAANGQAMLRPLGLALVAGLALANVFSVWEGERPRNLSITVPELFLGIALVVLEPRTALLVAVVGGLVAHPLRRVVGPLRGVPTRTPLVLVHGLSMPALRGVVAVAVVLHVGSLRWAHLIGADERVGAAMVAVLVVVLVDGVVMTGVVRLETGLPVRQAAGPNGLVEWVAPLSLGAVGVLVGAIVDGQSVAWMLVVVLAAATVGVARAGTRWSRERRHARAVLNVAAAATGSTGLDQAIERVCAQIGTALLADRVELVPTRPAWAAVAARIGEHGWLGVADRAVPTQSDFDHRDQALLDAVAGVAAVTLDNAVMLQRLEDEHEMRSILLAAAAHDLRSPLATARTALESLDQDLPPDLRAQVVGAGVRGAERANQLVHDLIVLEREHVVPDDVGTATVASVVQTMLAGLQAEDRGRCSLQLDPVPDVGISPILLERVLDNLVGNALKHTRSTTPIDLRVRREGPWVVIAVEDRGPGVAPEDRDRLVAPFARGRTGAAGHGLGLHIANEFVRRCGGHIVVADRDDGVGASFRVHLPVAQGCTAS